LFMPDVMASSDFENFASKKVNINAVCFNSKRFFTNA
jgi:hypothetical protein